MATMRDVEQLALELPDVTESTSYGNRTWSVGVKPNGKGGKHFVWERPFSQADLRRFGDEEPPDGLIVAVRVDDLGEKEAVLAAQPAAFTIPHFDGYAAVLIQMRRITRRPLRELIVDGWLAVAPPALAEELLAR